MRMPKIPAWTARLALLQPLHAVVPAGEKEALEPLLTVGHSETGPESVARIHGFSQTLQWRSSGSGVVAVKEALCRPSGTFLQTRLAVKIIPADGRELRGKALGMNGKIDLASALIDPPRTCR